MSLAEDSGSVVLAVLVAHASRTRVREALRSVAEQTYPNLRVLVVAIGTLEIPTDTGVTAQVLRAPEGTGFAEAVTLGLKAIPIDDVDHVLLLHDDVSLDPQAVEKLVRTADADQSVAAIGAKLLEWDRPDVLQEVGAAVDRYAIRRSNLDPDEADAGQRDDTTDVLFCSDACLLVRKMALQAVGGLDPHAWPFYEDVDLCWRLHARGLRVVVAPEARVRHAADLSRGRRLFDALALREHAERGRLRFMLKHYALLGLIVLIPQIAIASIARILAAIARRELWRVRLILGAWTSVFRELPEIWRARRAAGEHRVGDREILQLATRGSVAGVRGERAEFASRFFAAAGRVGNRALALLRQPVAWAGIGAVVVTFVLIRNILFGSTFALGELRALPTFGDAIADHFGRVRREGLDPFAPGGPGVVVLGALRTLLLSGALAEKVVLILPLVLGGFAGARLGRALGLSQTGRRWLAIPSAVNPVTLSLVRDGNVGALALWVGCLWMASELLAPSPPGEGRATRLRFFCRYAFGWAVVVALHPPALIWLLAMGGVLVIARRRPEGGPRTDDDRARLQMLAFGAAGSFLLLLPWSVEWFTRRSPLLGPPAWLVSGRGGGLSPATLGGSWPFLAWVALAFIAATFVGWTRTTLAFAVLVAIAVAAGIGGVLPRETALVGAASAALLVVAVCARRILEDLPSYELGSRHAAMLAGIVAIAGLWFGGAVLNIAPGLRTRALPSFSADAADTGRVLWLAQTTGGVRSWTTLSFSDRLSTFPPPSGPAERLASRAISAARDDRTHRVGGILALEDISHVVALDAASGAGLDGQADLAPLEVQDNATIYRNDAWRGPAMILAGAPSHPLTPLGLAGIVREAVKVPVRGWPFGPIALDVSGIKGLDPSSVLYVATGPRGGAHVQGAHAKRAADGAYVPAADVGGSVRISAPGRWWRWMLPLEALLVLVLLAGWFASAYAAGPSLPLHAVGADVRNIVAPSYVLAGAPVVALLAFLIGWAGVQWGTGGPFLSSAWYCPPVGGGFQQGVAIVNPNRTGTEILVRSNLRTPPIETRHLGEHARVSVVVPGAKGAVVESFGRRVAVGTEVSRFGRRDTSLCARGNRELNVFPEGGRFATRAIPRLFERYVIYNPFSDLARASVRFVSPNEPIAPPPLQDVRIPSGTAVVIDPETQFEPMLDLSTTIRIWQGRAIVARRLRTVDQVTWTLSVPLSQGGVLPRALTDNSTTAVIGVNPDPDEPAVVTVSGSVRGAKLSPDRFEIPPLARETFDVNKVVPNGRDMVVRFSSDRPVALEGLVAPENRKAVSLMPPLEPSRNWVIPIAEQRSLYVVNPTGRTIRVSVDRLGPGGAIPDFFVEPNRVRAVALHGTRGFGVLVHASGEITAAAVGPRGSTTGISLD